MISRIAAAFVLVFYIALLVDAGLEFLGLGDTPRQLGDDPLLGADELGRAAGRVVAVPLPRPRARLTVVGLVFLLAGIDEISDPRLRARVQKAKSKAIAGETRLRPTGGDRRDARRAARARRRLRRRRGAPSTGST